MTPSPRCCRRAASSASGSSPTRRWAAASSPAASPRRRSSTKATSAAPGRASRATTSRRTSGSPTRSGKSRGRRASPRRSSRSPGCWRKATSLVPIPGTKRRDIPRAERGFGRRRAHRGRPRAHRRRASRDIRRALRRGRDGHRQPVEAGLRCDRPDLPFPSPDHASAGFAGIAVEPAPTRGGLQRGQPEAGERDRGEPQPPVGAQRRQRDQPRDVPRHQHPG